MQCDASLAIPLRRLHNEPFATLLQQRQHSFRPHCESLPYISGRSAQAFEVWRQDLQRALAVAFAQTQHTFAAKGVEAGTTATVVLQTGWLVTCANVGDSLGFIDHGNEVCHRRRFGIAARPWLVHRHPLPRRSAPRLRPMAYLTALPCTHMPRHLTYMMASVLKIRQYAVCRPSFNRTLCADRGRDGARAGF